MKKRFIEIGIGMVFLTLVLGGCGKDMENETEKKRTTLTYMAPRYGNEFYVGSEFVEQVNKEESEIYIEARTYSEEQYYTALKAKLATGEGPDLFFVQPDYAGANGIASLAQSGYLEPVDELSSVASMKAEGEEDALLKYNSHVYSISTGRMALGVVYNKELFSNCGLKVPQYWEEFLGCCEKLKESGIRPFIQGGKDAQTLQYGIYQIAANQIYPADPEFDEGLRTGSRRFTDKGSWDHVLNMYLSLYESGYMGSDVQKTGSKEALHRFGNGEAAMMFVSASEADSLVRERQEEFGFFFLPANDKGDDTYSSIAEIGGVSIYAKSQNVEVCKKVLDEVFWKSAASQAAEARRNTAKAFPMVEQAYESKEYFPLCNQGWYNEVELIMERMVGEYISGGNVEIADITSAMQKELEK